MSPGFPIWPTMRRPPEETNANEPPPPRFMRGCETATFLRQAAPNGKLIRSCAKARVRARPRKGARGADESLPVSRLLAKMYLKQALAKCTRPSADSFKKEKISPTCEVRSLTLLLCRRCSPSANEMEGQIVKLLIDQLCVLIRRQ